MLAINSFGENPGLGDGGSVEIGANWSTAQATRSVNDGVLYSTTELTSATATFTAADVGRVVTGVATDPLSGNQVIMTKPNTYIAAYVSGTQVTLNQASNFRATGVTVVIMPPPVLEASPCTTTYRYQVCYIDPLDGRICSAIGQTTAGPNALNWGNWVDVIEPVDSSATSFAMYACTGGGCTPQLCQTEQPTYQYGFDNDPLVASISGPGSFKTYPTHIYFHDLGAQGCYAHDQELGATVSAGQVINDDVLTSISSISGNSLAMATPAAASTITTIWPDAGPSYNSVVGGTCNNNTTTPNATAAQVIAPSGSYPIAQTIGETRCKGIRVTGVGAGGKEANVQFIWHGPLGGTAMGNYQTRDSIFENFALRGPHVSGAAAGNTFGVGIDIDGFDNDGHGYTVTSTHHRYTHLDVDTAQYGVRLANVDQGNDEGMLFDNVRVSDFLGQGNPLNDGNGMFGYYINGEQAVHWQIENMMEALDAGGNIQLIDFGAGGKFGPNNDIASPDGIGIWLGQYLYNSEPLETDNVGSEWLTKGLVYPFQQNFGVAWINMHDWRASSMHLVQDNAFIFYGGQGTMSIEHTKFHQLPWNFEGVDGYIKTNGVGFDSKDTAYTSQSGLPLSPFGGNPAPPQVITYGDIVRGNANGGTTNPFTPWTNSKLGITSGTAFTVNAGCPYTILNSLGYYGTQAAPSEQDAGCFVHSGASVPFPYQNGQQDFSGTFGTTNGRSWCYWKLEIQNDSGSPATITVAPSILTAPGTGCTSTFNNPQTFNLSWGSLAQTCTSAGFTDAGPFPCCTAAGTGATCGNGLIWQNMTGGGVTMYPWAASGR